MYRIKDYINIDKEILSGNPVFKGTRVPIQTLFDHIEKGIPLDEFLDDFPTVKKAQAIAVIEIAGKILTCCDGWPLDNLEIITGVRFASQVPVHAAIVLHLQLMHG
ncbi:MAG: DUF433 domain-containing protein [Cytophagales bacterium]|nr:DUF433 domain-containing protein [Cytophagales bacterium]